MQIIREILSLDELKKMAGHYFSNMIKGVVDVEKELLALDAELHSDLENLMLSQGSSQKNLWGINLYPELSGDDFIEFDSMINVRPAQNNPSRDVSSPSLRAKILEVVRLWIPS